ncbi:Pdrg1 [Symbiodinium sp. CCMP2592]|nr:Pdrg1 [Symbiodinium sp. CCMP2592]
MGPFSLESWKSLPSIPYGEKKLLWGKRRAAVGGKTATGETDDEGAAVDRDEIAEETGAVDEEEIELPDVGSGRGSSKTLAPTVQQPVVYHEMPVTLWESALQATSAAHIIDVTPQSGRLAAWAVCNRLGYVGIACTQHHMEYIEKTVMKEVLAALSNPGSGLYAPALADKNIEQKAKEEAKRKQEEEKKKKAETAAVKKRKENENQSGQTQTETKKPKKDEGSSGSGAGESGGGSTSGLSAALQAMLDKAKNKEASPLSEASFLGSNRWGAVTKSPKAHRAQKNLKVGVRSQADTKDHEDTFVQEDSFPELSGYIVKKGTGSVGGHLYFDLEELTGGTAAAPRWFDLESAVDTPFEELDQALALCRTAVICPTLDLTDRRKVRALRDGLKKLLDSMPLSLSRVLMLSTVGARGKDGGFNVGSFFGVDFKTGTYASLEDELTSLARQRPVNKPLKVVIVRAGPAPRAATRSEVCCSLEEIVGSTSLQTASAALLHALVFDVDAGFTVVDTPLATAATSFRGPRWERLLLPCVGPEIWRMDVDDARAAALFVQQWAGTFVGVGTGAVARFGMKTPVELQETSCGCLLKFRPVGTPPAKKFEELEEGGVEFLAEAASFQPWHEGGEIGVWDLIDGVIKSFAGRPVLIHPDGDNKMCRREMLLSHAKIMDVLTPVLQTQEKLVELDRQRNGRREALGAFRRGETNVRSSQWIATQGQFIRLPGKTARSWLTEQQQDTEKQIATARSDLKVQLQDLLAEHPRVTDLPAGVSALLLSEQRPPEAPTEQTKQVGSKRNALDYSRFDKIVTSDSEGDSS